VSKIVIVGEAYGRQEALFEHPFVGTSGVELARMLHQADLTPNLATPFPSALEMLTHWKMVEETSDIIVTNVFGFQPRDNQIDLCFASVKEGMTSIPPLKAGKYLRHDLYFHLEALWQKINEAEPHLILALGNTASWAVLGESKISTLRGTVKLSSRLNYKVLPTYHPAAVLRQWNLRPIVVTDLEKAKREAESPAITRIKRFVIVEPSLEEIAEWLLRSAGFYAVDIETKFKQISMIGFARSPTDAIVVPFIDENKPGWNYWASPREEMAAWRLVDKLLKKPVPKVFQNGIYDLSYILTAGLRPVMCDDDSMLLHHSLYPEMLKGLGFLGSIYSDEIAWKTMRTKGDNLKRDE
jgi:uracil-DNA glycosylase